MALEGPTQNWPGMHRRSAMNAHFPDALMQGWEPLVTGVVLPDPDDQHVVSAAMRGGADCIRPTTCGTSRPTRWRS